MKAKVLSTAAFRLENNLLLLPFIASKLGLNKPGDLAQFRDVPEGCPAGENSTYMFFALVPKAKISADKLKEYDTNIQRYEKALSTNRGSKISLKYFQYLSALFTEIFLDEYFARQIDFLNEINKYIEESPNPFDFFAQRDLKKIAYWMATGSGKTLLLHINYWQFQKYNQGPNKIDIDNVILITQSEKLSEQHQKELKASGISSEIFDASTEGYFADYDESRRKVKIIDIYKLKLPEDKKGEGVTVDVSSFGSKNLVFVDEGHKGIASEDKKWKKAREALSFDGFTFEYSATFGQALGKPDDQDFIEYSKSIIFDYSYKYFFADGYGKDFAIHYIDPDRFSEESIDNVLLANTLIFYEQKKIYELSREQFSNYNISNPLWIFVGHKVQEDESDLLVILSFFKRFIANKNQWSINSIQRILEGESGLLGKDGRDIFALQNPERNFVWLRAQHFQAESLFKDILRDVFLVPDEAEALKLHLVDIRSASGEIALRAGDSKIFGIIDIGNKSTFLNHVKEQNVQDITVDIDTFTPSLFRSIESDNSTVNILIGAKKFIEGWNSWRVSCMGLLNVGKREGAQIIQLFGRGVRLKGKEDSLKRSRTLPGEHPPFIQLLETLNVFGIRAAYLETFREAIEKEEVSFKDIEIDTKVMQPFPNGLQLLKQSKPAEDFLREVAIFFQPSELQVHLDLFPRVGQVISLTEEPMYQTDSKRIPPKLIPYDLVNILDWDYILSSMLEVKKERRWHNLLLTKENIQKVILEEKYEVLCNDGSLEVEKFADLRKLENLAIMILTKYLERTYSKHRKTWEKDNVKLENLREEDSSLLRKYSVSVKETDSQLYDSIVSDRDSGAIYQDSNTIPIRNLYFNKHLFQPLLRKTGGNVVLTPNLLNEGEIEFVTDLRDYILSAQEKFTGKSIYVVRNLARGSGVGFFVEDSFYPDFIIWIQYEQKQTISFIDPKGLIFFPDLESPKLTLYRYLKDELTPHLGNPDVRLDAFIVSTTPFASLRERYSNRTLKISEYEERHILFQYNAPLKKNTGYIERMFDIMNDGHGPVNGV